MLLVDFSTYAFIWFPILYIAMLVIKKRISNPRIGPIRLTFRQRKLMMRSMLLSVGITALLVILSMVLVLFTIRGGYPWFIIWLNKYFAEPGLLIFGLIISVLISSFAYSFKIKRWSFYALLTLVVFSVGSVFETNLFMALPILIGGLVITIPGTMLLIRFLSNHPKPVKEEIGTGGPDDD
jgi:hypothetical protein